MKTNGMLRALVLLYALVLISPIAILVVLSFTGEAYLHFPPRSYSVQWYQRFLFDTAWQRALWTSLVVGAISCLFASVIGFLGAYAFVRGRFRGKKLLLSGVLLPIIVPQIITAIAIYQMSISLGLVGNRFWMAICHAMLSLPVVVVMLISALQAVDENLERAALGLGCSRPMMFRRVVVPLALPGVVSSALFAFLASFEELIVALFLSGVSSQTLSVQIWNSLQMTVEPTIAAVSAFLIAVTVAVLLADRAIRRRTGA